MEELATRFPRDMDYVISLDTTLPVSEGINEIVHTLFEAVGWSSSWSSSSCRTGAPR
jgi:multidrug efflux pump subunit AcrB